MSIELVIFLVVLTVLHQGCFAVAAHTRPGANLAAGGAGINRKMTHNASYVS
jgi:uncharacterized protein YceK